MIRKHQKQKGQLKPGNSTIKKSEYDQEQKGYKQEMQTNNMSVYDQEIPQTERRGMTKKYLKQKECLLPGKTTKKS